MENTWKPKGNLFRICALCDSEGVHQFLLFYPQGLSDVTEKSGKSIYACDAHRSKVEEQVQELQEEIESRERQPLKSAAAVDFNSSAS